MIQSAKKGYSPSLKHLNRVERCSLAHVHDCCFGPNKQDNLALIKVDTKQQAADMFTKRLDPKSFIQARSMLQILDPQHLDEVIRTFLVASMNSRVKKPLASPGLVLVAGPGDDSMSSPGAAKSTAPCALAPAVGG